MAKTIDLNARHGHQFEKSNLITKKDKTGFYDNHQCTLCGMKGKRYGLNEYLHLSYNYSSDKIEQCPKGSSGQPKRIKIIRCNGYGEAFKNLIPNSEHEVIKPPVSYKDDHKGEWIMGNGEPVKVLNNEFEIIE